MTSLIRNFVRNWTNTFLYKTMKTEKITLDRLVRTVGVIILLTAVFLLLRRLSTVLVPFFIAWIIAYMLYPIVCFFQYKCRLKSRFVSIVVTLLSFIGAFTGLIMAIGPSIEAEATHMKDIIVEYFSGNNTVTIVAQEIEVFIKQNIEIEDLVQMLTFDDIANIVEEKLPQVMDFLVGSMNAVVGFICSLITIIYLFFILMDYENMYKGLMGLVPKRQRPVVQEIMSDVKKGMNGYFRGQAIIAFIVGILFSIGFYIIGLPLAIPLGLFIGFLNLVPYLQTVGFIPAVLLALLQSYDTGQNFWYILLGIFIVFCIVQGLQDWVITPHIMGNITGLNAAIILLALSVWGSLLGIVGLIIALPLTSLLVSYYKRYVIGHEDEDTSES